MSDNFERPHASGEGIGLTQPEFEKSETAFADHRSAWGSSLDDRQGRFRLIWTQAVHWAAVLVVMNITLLSGVQQFIPTPATSLVLLLLLALGTFLAGLNLSLLPICFLGAALAFAVPIISWLKLSVLFLVLITVFLVGIAMALWPKRSGQTATRKSAARPADAHQAQSSQASIVF
jgi:hypothetical protein